jgi:hypothetical protein
VRRFCLSAIVSVALIGAPAAAQVISQPAETPPTAESAPSAESADHQIYQRRMPYDHTLRVREGEVRVQLGRLRSGDIFISIPVEHRRTFVTLEDAVQGRVFLGPHLSIPAGSRGFEVEDVEITRITQQYPYTYSATYIGPVRCFFVDPEEPLKARCVSPDGVTGGQHDLVSKRYSVSAPQPEMPMPRIEYRPIVFVEDLRLEYRLRAWSLTRALLGVYVNGEMVETIYDHWSSTGVAEFELPVGILRLEKGGTNPQRATATLRPYDPAR